MTLFLFSNSVETRLQAMLPALGDSRTTGRLVSVTLRVPAPGTPTLSAPRNGDFWWSRPAEKHWLYGLGSCLNVRHAGAERITRLSADFRRLQTNWDHLDPDATGFQPAAFVGLAFDVPSASVAGWQGFPDSGLFVPELLVQQQGRDRALTFSGRCDPERMDDLWRRWRRQLRRLCQTPRVHCPNQDRQLAIERVMETPTPHEWSSLARSAIEIIRRGGLEKVVTCRRLELRASQPFDVPRLIARLEHLYPDCLLFAARLGARTLVSATPERLVRKQGDRISCDAIAGTIQRADASRHDRLLGQRMFASAKNREEHAIVVTAVGNALGPVCRELRIAPRPNIRKLRHVQHLWTEVTATVAADAGLLDLAARLHPTPAVNGTPALTALTWLRTHERVGRGWYTGAGGWIDREGNGELAVLLRCALLAGRHAMLYAGSGLVAASNPDTELRETELKFETMLEALELA